MSRYDVIIAGAGLNGLALALALGGRRCRRPLNVLLYDKGDPAAAVSGARDSRASALSSATCQMMRALGCWEAMAAHAEGMGSIVVSDGKNPAARPALLTFPEDSSREVAAVMVENKFIFSSLLAEVNASPSITFKTGVTAQNIHFGPGLAQVHLSDGMEAKGELIVGADGRGSAVREAAGIAFDGLEYPQSAITLTIGHSLPHNRQAQEHFSPDGVLAVLPLTGDRSSIVWAMPRDKAKATHELPDEAFLRALSQDVGEALGTLSLLSPRHVHPLSTWLAKNLAGPGVALVGDAGHVVHPLAGLGLNLGFKDAAALADCVHEAHGIGQDVGSLAVLETYMRWRRFDTQATAAMLDGMNRLFSNDVVALRQIRQFGLRLVDRVPPLKDALMNEAAGTFGSLPRLMRGLAA